MSAIRTSHEMLEWIHGKQLPGESNEATIRRLLGNPDMAPTPWRKIQVNAEDLSLKEAKKLQDQLAVIIDRLEAAGGGTDVGTFDHPPSDEEVDAATGAPTPEDSILPPSQGQFTVGNLYGQQPGVMEVAPSLEDQQSQPTIGNSLRGKQPGKEEKP